MSREIFSIWSSVLIALSLILNFLSTACDRHNRSLHFWTVSQLRCSVWGPVKPESLSLSLFSFCLHTALRKRDPALEACKEPPQPFSHCPLSLEKTAFSFSFLSLKMNSPINPSSTDHSEKERKRERRLELCVCEVFFSSSFLINPLHLGQEALLFVVHCPFKEINVFYR